MIQHRVAQTTQVLAARIFSSVTELKTVFIGSAWDLADVRLEEYDVVTTRVGLPFPILGKGRIERALRARRRRPMLVADLGAPRDVEAEAAELEDLFLYTAEDLGRIASLSSLPSSSSSVYIRSTVSSHSVSPISKAPGSFRPRA